jgi:hypothetical protein
MNVVVSVNLSVNLGLPRDMEWRSLVAQSSAALAFSIGQAGPQRRRDFKITLSVPCAP